MSKKKTETLLAHEGLSPIDEHAGIVNIPPYRASTIRFDKLEDLSNGTKNYFYGSNGTPPKAALEKLVAELEGGYGAVAVSSGTAAIATAMLTFIKAGDHILVTDSIYSPGRRYADNVLKKLGIDVEYYDPTIGAGISDLVKDNTALIYMESPGSHTFEIQDVPAITAVAKHHGIKTALDNTWATPLHLQPHELGVDLSLHSGSKYFVGHSDAVIGVISCKDEECYAAVHATFTNTSAHVGSEEVYLCLRGLRSLAPRLRQQSESALKIAQWIKEQDTVKGILHPADENHPQHNIFKRDFKGASSVFSIILPEKNDKALASFVDNLDYFGIGMGWGGFESLILPFNPVPYRTATEWTEKGPLVRLHIGLENTDDLIDDLANGLERYKTALG